MLKHLLIVLTLILGLSSLSINADEASESNVEALNVAVASDFAPTAKRMAKEFTAITAIPVNITSGSSQELLQQIKKGAQFDVYMSANTNYPLDLTKTGYTDGNPVLYALGTLALYAKGKEITHSGLDVLQPGGFTQLAIADPKQAPYGVAAIETLKKLKIYDQVQNQIVLAPNVLRALDMAASGQVDAALVSYGDLSDEQRANAWIVPSRMHKPIKQAQVAIKGGNAAASQKWIKFIETDTGKNILISSGYGVTNVEEITK